MTRNGSTTPLPNEFITPPSWSSQTSRGRRGFSERNASSIGRGYRRRHPDNASVLEQPDRLRALVEAGIAVTSELSLEAVLQRIVEAAAAITGATYAALGVIDLEGQRLERFVTTGMSAEQRAAIGDLPRGRG